MPAPVAGIHVFLVASKTWMAGTGPAMTTLRIIAQQHRHHTRLPNSAIAAIGRMKLAANTVTISGASSPYSPRATGKMSLRYLVCSAPACSARVISEALRANQVGGGPGGA